MHGNARELTDPDAASLIPPEAHLLPSSQPSLPGGVAGARVQRSSLPELFGAMLRSDSDNAGALLVEDNAQAEGGQMRRGEFMGRLRAEVCRVAEEELARAGRSAADCPYIDLMLAYYDGRSTEQLERAVRRIHPKLGT